MPTDPPDPPDLPGRVWLSIDRTIVHMQGEVDVVAVADFRDTLGVPDFDALAVADVLDHVREFDMSAVTFADSAAVGLIASVAFVQARSGRRITLRSVPDSVRFVLDVTGVLPQVDLAG